MKTFPFYKQLDSMDCGPTCLKMIAKHYGKDYSITFLREKCYIDRAGVSLMGICGAAESLGFKTMAVKLQVFGEKHSPVLSEAPLPAILHWNQNHFVVLYKINKKFAWIADPADGLHKLPISEFNKSWLSDENKGIALLLESGKKFLDVDSPSEDSNKFHFLLNYLKPHKRLFIQLLIGLVLGTVMQLIIPFLTQSLVDVGIETKDIGFIYLILAGQLFLFLGSTTVRFIQSWILLHISVRINVSLVSDFLTKLMNLPLSFFDAKNTGDLLQRISDHKRIETFLTNSSLSILLSLTNLLVFGVVLAIYNATIFCFIPYRCRTLCILDILLFENEEGGGLPCFQTIIGKSGFLD